MDWIEEIDFEEDLEGDMKLIYETIGREAVLQLWKELPGMNIYISTKALNRAKERYIQKHYDGKNTKKLAVALKVSERFVNGALNKPMKS